MSTCLLAVSCQKDTTLKEVAAESNDFSNSSFIQVYNATVGSSRTYVYVDGAPVTGAAVAYGGTFPTLWSSSQATPSQFAVPAGLRAFLIRDTLITTTQPAMSLAENLTANTTYTLFTYDTLNTIKNKLVRTDIVFPDDTTARLRFANFAYSPNALTPVDVFSKNLNANIFTNVATTDVTGFIPYNSRKADTLFIRPTGSSVNYQNNTNTAASPTYAAIQLIINPTRKRSYTILWRGSFRTDLNSAANVRTLTSFFNN